MGVHNRDSEREGRDEVREERGPDRGPEAASDAIEAARQHLHELEVKLLELQKQCLARGTRDVLEKAREVVHVTMDQVEDDLNEFEWD